MYLRTEGKLDLCVLSASALKVSVQYCTRVVVPVACSTSISYSTLLYQYYILGPSDGVLCPPSGPGPAVWTVCQCDITVVSAVMHSGDTLYGWCFFLNFL